MAIVRTCALERLAEILVCNIPELVDRVCVGAPPSSHEQTYPSMTINGMRWTFQPDEVEDLPGSPPGMAIRRVGSHDGTVQIRVLATTPAERDDLSQRIVDAFTGFEDENGDPHPGVILARVTECGFIPWTASFDLDRDEWINLAAFDRKYEALIEVDASVPAIVCKTGVPTIETLRLGLTGDFTSTPSAATMQPPAVEVVQILQDGTMVPYTP